MSTVEDSNSYLSSQDIDTFIQPTNHRIKQLYALVNKSAERMQTTKEQNNSSSFSILMDKTKEQIKAFDESIQIIKGDNAYWINKLLTIEELKKAKSNVIQNVAYSQSAYQALRIFLLNLSPIEVKKAIKAILNDDRTNENVFLANNMLQKHFLKERKRRKHSYFHDRIAELCYKNTSFVGPIQAENKRTLEMLTDRRKNSRNNKNERHELVKKSLTEICLKVSKPKQESPKSKIEKINTLSRFTTRRSIVITHTNTEDLEWKRVRILKALEKRSNTFKKRKKQNNIVNSSIDYQSIPLKKEKAYVQNSIISSREIGLLKRHKSNINSSFFTLENRLEKAEKMVDVNKMNEHIRNILKRARYKGNSLICQHRNEKIKHYLL